MSKDITSFQDAAFVQLFEKLLSVKALPYALKEEEEKEQVPEPEEEESSDDDGAYIEDGCCLLCERFMPLTKHHLVPRETHSWYSLLPYALLTLQV
jgi:hypothetical protein